MKATSLFGGAILVGCAAGPKPAPAPVPVETRSVELVPFDQCIDGVVRAGGSELPFDGKRIGYPLPARGPRAASLLKGGCALDGAIAECRKQHAPKMRGYVLVDLTIGKDGKVQTATRGFGVPDDPFSKCVVDTFRTANFPADAAGSAQFRESFPQHVWKIEEYPSRFWMLPTEPAKQVLRAAFPRIRDCYWAFLKRKNRLILGTLFFNFEIKADGTLASVHVDYTESFRDPELLQCEAKVVSSLTFAPLDQPRATIHYPLQLSAELAD